MCVIIYVPKESTIGIEEIKDAWLVNPDGAGYSIQKDGKVYFKRGFMKLENFIEEISPLIGEYNLMLHFRISTSKSVNKIQTHPYKKGNVTITEGYTLKPVICMNGIISGQKEYLDCNDTMSYIIDHSEAFGNLNQDILNIIEDATGAKWAVMMPDEVLLSSEFKEHEGRFYSNKNHLFSYYTNRKRKTYFKRTFNNMIRTSNLRKAIKKDKILHEDLEDFINSWCNSDSDYLCNICTKCLKSAKTLRDVKITLNENFYFEDEYDINDNETKTCSLDYYYSDDIYNYNNDYDYWEQKDNKCCNIFD